MVRKGLAIEIHDKLTARRAQPNRLRPLGPPLLPRFDRYGTVGFGGLAGFEPFIRGRGPFPTSTVRSLM